MYTNIHSIYALHPSTTREALRAWKRRSMVGGEKLNVGHTEVMVMRSATNADANFGVVSG